MRFSNIFFHSPFTNTVILPIYLVRCNCRLRVWQRERDAMCNFYSCSFIFPYAYCTAAYYLRPHLFIAFALEDMLLSYFFIHVSAYLILDGDLDG